MATAQTWTLIGVVVAMLTGVQYQLHQLTHRITDLQLATERRFGDMDRQFGEIRGDIAVLKHDRG